MLTRRPVLTVFGAVPVDLVPVAAGNSSGVRDSFWSSDGPQRHARAERLAATIKPHPAPHAFAGGNVLEPGCGQRLWHLSSFDFGVKAAKW
jgi:hypothetical protein